LKAIFVFRIPVFMGVVFCNMSVLLYTTATVIFFYKRDQLNNTNSS